jgi:hypothetical protein
MAPFVSVLECGNCLEVGTFLAQVDSWLTGGRFKLIGSKF